MAERNECTMQLKLVHDTLIYITGNQFSDEGITFSQISYMGYLYQEKRPIPLKELESAFNVSQPTVAGIMKRLRQKGLAALEQDEQDYKAKNAVLTEKGIELYIKAESRRKALEERMYHDFSEKDIQNFYDLLSRLHTNLTEK